MALEPSEKTQVITARWIVPIDAPPIHGGWIRFQGQRIVEVGSSPTPSGARDLGDVAVLPGLVNAHTHLEFSDCPIPIGDPGMPLSKWIGEVIAARNASAGERDTAVQNAIRLGLAESIESGVRLMGEITTPPCSYDFENDLSDIELVTFAEVLGLSPARSTERMDAAVAHNEEYEHAAWSPHAPYSTSQSTIQRTVNQACQSGRPLAMHVAESPAERELLSDASGEFAGTLRQLGVWQEGQFPWGDEPYLDLISQLSAAPNILLIHCNDLREHEIHAIGKHVNVSVVYCPRTHDFFQFATHPFDQMIQAGVRVALGTDSRASNPDLNLWREVQYLLNHRTDVSPAEILRMATINGADALGRQEFGRLASGATPGIGTVATQAKCEADLYDDFATQNYSPCVSLSWF